MAPSSAGKPATPFNVSIGVMGHVDSGKTSLAKALSTIASTAAFDKHPESRRRGITLDLGFSAFFLEPSATFRDGGIDTLQITLVDCPGHAAFVRTVIGGSQIIDLMLLVIDAVKGIQTQTAESLVLAEITGKQLIIALNKIDLFPEAEREARTAKVVSKLRKTLADTPFADAPIIPVSANSGVSENDEQAPVSIGLDLLMETIRSALKVPTRNEAGSFVFAVDHCFAIKGQGTIMTGTVLNGRLSVGDSVEIPATKLVRKVKSMQMFRKPVNTVSQGDRAGICVSQLDPDSMEKGLIAAPNTISTLFAAIVSVQKVKYFKAPVGSKTKFHCTIGHETVLATVTFFMPTGDNADSSTFDTSQEYLYKDTLEDGERAFALLEFEVPVLAMQKSLYIASKLDTDITDKACRLAFYGTLLETFQNKDYRTVGLPQLKVFKWKSRTGTVDRLVDDYTVIGKGLFKKETVLQPFLNMAVKSRSGELGVLEGSFGQSGKYKIRFRQGVPAEVQEALGQKGAGKKGGIVNDGVESDLTLTLSFKKYVYSLDEKMVQ